MKIQTILLISVMIFTWKSGITQSCDTTLQVSPVFLYPMFESFRQSSTMDVEAEVRFDNYLPNPSALFLQGRKEMVSFGNDVLRTNNVNPQNPNVHSYKIEGCAFPCPTTDSPHRDFIPDTLYGGVIVEDSVKIIGPYYFSADKLGNTYERSDFDALNSYYSNFNDPCGFPHSFQGITNTVVHKTVLYNNPVLNNDSLLSTGTFYRIDTLKKHNNFTHGSDSNFLSGSCFFLTKTGEGLPFRYPYMLRGALLGGTYNSFIIGKQIQTTDTAIFVAGFYKRYHPKIRGGFPEYHVLQQKAQRAGIFLTKLSRNFDSLYSYCYDNNDKSDITVNAYRRSGSKNHLFCSLDDHLLTGIAKTKIARVTINDNGSVTNNQKISFLDNEPVQVIKIEKKDNHNLLLCKRKFRTTSQPQSYIFTLNPSFTFIRSLGIKGVNSTYPVKINDFIYKNGFLYLSGSYKNNACIIKVDTTPNIPLMTKIRWVRTYTVDFNPSLSSFSNIVEADSNTLIAFGKTSYCGVNGHLSVRINLNNGESRCTSKYEDVTKIAVDERPALVQDSVAPIMGIDTSVTGFHVLQSVSWNLTQRTDSGIVYRNQQIAPITLPQTCGESTFAQNEHFPYQGFLFEENICGICCGKLAYYNVNSKSFCLNDTAVSEFVMPWDSRYRVYSWESYKQYPEPEGWEMYKRLRKKKEYSKVSDTLLLIDNSYTGNPKYTVMDGIEPYHLLSSARDSFCAIKNYQHIKVNNPVFRIDETVINDTTHILKLVMIVEPDYIYTRVWTKPNGTTSSADSLVFNERDYKSLGKTSIKFSVTIYPNLTGCDRQCATTDEYIVCLKSIYGNCCDCK